APAPVHYISKDISDVSEIKKFMGKPRPELDEAWRELLRGTMIRYNEEELLHANNATSIKLKDGGFAGGLGVSHSLHCLQFLHPEYYNKHEAQDRAGQYEHVDHCVESLRQQVLCLVDTNLYTLRWTSHSRSKPSPWLPQPQVCVNWDYLHQWMKKRAVSHDELVPPPEEPFNARTTIITQ
ncbi:hypothetical protein GQ53DRAFT_666530, partial [Thozetella sp. PMI_491]